MKKSQATGHKTLGTYVCQYFKMPHLYRDDLEEIETAIRRHLNPKEYHLSFGGNSYTGLDETPAHAPTMNVLVFYTHNPCVRLKFTRSWAELYCAETNEDITDGLQEIKRIVQSCERRRLWCFSRYSNWCAPMLGFGAMAAAVEAVTQQLLPRIAVGWGLGLLALCAVWWFVGFDLTVRRYCRIDFQRERTR